MLTDTNARKAKPIDKPYKLADGGGLYLAVMPEGGKLWRWKYRSSGSEKLMAIGRNPQVSLTQAREIHAEKRRVLAAGGDPMARRKAEKTAERNQNENAFEPFALLR